ncbi:hypothetical protein E2C01_031087 [Portunus trituberculatus]|uniref:Uncharacterized protein n=1 Tax=Portunus trituberculatus TaxID=210409 RepID=A0A5B7EX62_PORTR|nr:hypothetical protein [Portunus trituberculatus]
MFYHGGVWSWRGLDALLYRSLKTAASGPRSCSTCVAAVWTRDKGLARREGGTQARPHSLRAPPPTPPSLTKMEIHPHSPTSTAPHWCGRQPSSSSTRYDPRPKVFH